MEVIEAHGKKFTVLNRVNMERFGDDAAIEKFLKGKMYLRQVGPNSQPIDNTVIMVQEILEAHFEDLPNEPVVEPPVEQTINATV